MGEHRTDIADRKYLADLQSLSLKQCQISKTNLSTKQLEKFIKRGGWTKAEDEKILKHAKNVGNKDWLSLASHFPDRNDAQLRNRFKKLLSAGIFKCEGFEKVMFKKGGWTVEEDRMILEHFKHFGGRNWSLLASKLPGRNAIQCRNRHNKLSTI